MANREQAVNLRDIVKFKTGQNITVPAAMKLLTRFDQEIIADALEAMPLDTEKPYGFILVYCQKNSSPEQLKTNPKLTIKLDDFLKKNKEKK